MCSILDFNVLFVNFRLFPQTKVFGVSLESLPYYNMECGSVPRQVDMLIYLYLHSQLECYLLSNLVPFVLITFHFPFLAFWSTHVWNCWHMSTQRACSENPALSFVWKRSGWVMAEVDLAFIKAPWPWERSDTTEFVLFVQAKLDAGEECLSTALPCDVAGLVKQFFRELPEPVLPTELQEAFLKAQQLPAEEERTSATMLLSCVLPDRNITTLRYFFDFLHNVSKRCQNYI